MASVITQPWRVWQLGPDSGEGFIITTADGETEVTTRLDQELCEYLVALHNAELVRLDRTQAGYLRKALAAVLACGLVIDSVDDGGELHTSVSVAQALEIVKGVERAYVYFRPAGARVPTSWILVVWQGAPDADYDEPAEVLSDYTVNLEPVLARLQEGR